VRKTLVHLLSVLPLIVGGPAYAVKPKTKAPSAKEVRFLGRPIEKTISREGKDAPQTYPGRLLHVRKGSNTDTYAFIVDCDAGQVCSLNSASYCYFDGAWQYTAPGTWADEILDLSCPPEYPDAPTNAEEP